MQEVFAEDSAQRAVDFARKNNFPIEVTTAQRTLGPRPGAREPPHGTEVYVSRVPRELFEDTLMPIFKRAGKIYKFRLLMSPSGLSNRGVAYITYDTVDMAHKAIQTLDRSEIVPGDKISVKQSMDNRRIFLGGIPEQKHKYEIYEELHRIGMEGVVDVIAYQSYIDRNKNRGYVFVEFKTHAQAQDARLKFQQTCMFGSRVQIDWSTPASIIPDKVMQKVKKLFVRNLNVLQERDAFERVVRAVIGDITVHKVYKYRDYAFIHFGSRTDAERAMVCLREHFMASEVEVSWAKPDAKKRNHNSSSSSSSSAITTSPSTTGENNNNEGNLDELMDGLKINNGVNCDNGKGKGKDVDGQRFYCHYCFAQIDKAQALRSIDYLLK